MFDFEGLEVNIRDGRQEAVLFLVADLKHRYALLSEVLVLANTKETDEINDALTSAIERYEFFINNSPFELTTLESGEELPF